MIAQWVEAKRNKDFATADRLRKELRDAGIDPDGTRANVDTGFNRNPTTTEYALQRWGPSAAYPWEEAAVRRAAEAFGENTAAVPRALHGENTAESSTVQSTTSGSYRRARKREREADEQSGAVEGAVGENATAEQAATSKIKHRATIRALPTYKPNGAPHTSARAPFGWRELKQEMTQRCKFEDRPCELLFVDVDDATGDHAALACNHTHPTCNHTHPACNHTHRTCNHTHPTCSHTHPA